MYDITSNYHKENNHQHKQKAIIIIIIIIADKIYYISRLNTHMAARMVSKVQVIKSIKIYFILQSQYFSVLQKISL